MRATQPRALFSLVGASSRLQVARLRRLLCSARLAPGSGIGRHRPHLRSLEPSTRARWREAVGRDRTISSPCAARGDSGTPAFTGRIYQRWILRSLGRSPNIVCVSEATLRRAAHRAPTTPRACASPNGLNYPASRAGAATPSACSPRAASSAGATAPCCCTSAAATYRRIAPGCCESSQTREAAARPTSGWLLAGHPQTPGCALTRAGRHRRPRRRARRPRQRRPAGVVFHGRGPPVPVAPRGPDRS